MFSQCVGLSWETKAGSRHGVIMQRRGGMGLRRHVWLQGRAAGEAGVTMTTSGPPRLNAAAASRVWAVAAGSHGRSGGGRWAVKQPVWGSQDGRVSTIDTASNPTYNRA
jgi:hypothetical protein